MKNFLRRFRRNERGAAAIEYAMLVVFIALVIAGGATVLGNDVSALFRSIGATLQGVVPVLGA